MKKTLALVLSLLLLFSLAACSSKTEEPKSKLDQIKEAGELVLGTSADYPPAEFHVMENGEDKIIGYDITLAQYIADDLGVDLKVVDMAFDGLCISLSKGEFDLVISGMSMTEERLKSVDFTVPYYHGEQVILVRTEDADLYNTTADLAGKKVAVQSGTIQVPVANELFGEENVVTLVKNQDIILELQNKKVDVAYIDKMPSLAFASANSDIMVKDVGIVIDNEEQSIAVQKGNEEFLEYLNGIVTKLLEDGSIDQFIADAQTIAGVDE